MLGELVKIQVKTKTSIDGETYDDYSSKLEIPNSSDFEMYVDNGGLVICALNEVSDGNGKKRDISVELVFDRELSRKIAEACKDLPKLPK
ncbi:hypothetical protein [Methanocella sp. MCL-LM]|uniref:hypothetical protein n=1 Tax=Methanocella sp. MCL-LM TaxID=3412035 RepID=UPI003C76E8E5